MFHPDTWSQLNRLIKGHKQSGDEGYVLPLNNTIFAAFSLKFTT